MRSFPSGARRLLPVLVLAAFALRALYCWSFPARVHNTDNYVDIAASFAATGTLAFEGALTAAREPFYPMLLGAVFKLFGARYAVTALFNCFLGAVSIAALFWAGRRLFGERIAVLACLIAAVYPPFLFYAAQPVRETLMVLMSLLCLTSLLHAFDSDSPWAHAGAGAVNALAALTITTFLPFGLFIVPPVLLWLKRPRWARAARLSACYLAGFIALYGLWPLRNYRAFHTWVLGSTAAAGGVFYIYQVVPQELGGTPGESAIIAADPVWQASAAIADPAIRQQFYWKAGLRKVKENPARFLRLVAWRFFVDQWRLTPRPRSYDHDFWKVRLVSLLTDGWILPLAFVGLFFWRLRPPEAVLIPAIIISLNLCAAPILTVLRYRLPLMPWLILLAALSLDRIWEKVRATA